MGDCDGSGVGDEVVGNAISNLFNAEGGGEPVSSDGSRVTTGEIFASTDVGASDVGEGSATVIAAGADVGFHVPSNVGSSSGRSAPKSISGTVGDAVGSGVDTAGDDVGFDVLGDCGASDSSSGSSSDASSGVSSASGLVNVWGATPAYCSQ